MRKAVRFLLNKYVLSFSVFGAFMLFFDKNDIFTQMERKNNLGQLQQKKEHYTNEIAHTQKMLADLQNNSEALEKFSREKYYMKKDNEDIFIIEK